MRAMERKVNMYGLSHTMCWIGKLALLGSLCGFLSSCAMVKQKDREDLSDPVMQLQDSPLESGQESHSFPRREGSTGGNSGAGGGCGC